MNTQSVTKQMVTGYPFVSHVDQSQRPQLSVETIKTVFSEGYHSWFHTLSSEGVVRLMGYRYDFTPHLKRILVKQYNYWQEYYAPNKTALRKCLHGRIQEMVYINK